MISRRSGDNFPQPRNPAAQILNGPMSNQRESVQMAGGLGKIDCSEVSPWLDRNLVVLDVGPRDEFGMYFSETKHGVTDDRSTIE